METGLDYIRFNSDNDASALPQAEFRYGVSQDLELFISSLGWFDSDFASGFLDPKIGAKVNVSDAGETLNMAFLFQLSVPIGGDEVTSDDWDPGLGFIWAMPGGLGLAGTVLLSHSDSDFRVDNGIKLPFEFNNRHSAFVEWEANLPENGSSTHWLNGGYQWLYEYGMQFDFNAGVGIDDDAGDWRLGLGFSMRL